MDAQFGLSTQRAWRADDPVAMSARYSLNHDSNLRQSLMVRVMDTGILEPKAVHIVGIGSSILLCRCRLIVRCQILVEPRPLHFI